MQKIINDIFYSDLPQEGLADCLNYLGARDYIDPSTHIAILAIKDDEIIGSLSYAKEGAIEHIFVDPDYRNQNIAKELLKFYTLPSENICPDFFVDKRFYNKVVELVDSNSSALASV